MLLRHRPATRGVSLLRCNNSRRPHLPARYPSVQSSHDTLFNGSRLLVTRPEFAPARKEMASNPLRSPATQRPLATASVEAMPSDDIPFADHLPSSMPGGYARPPSSSPPVFHLKSFDPTTVLQVKVSEDAVQRARTSITGIPGGADEMMSVFEACLEVHKLDRAAIILERFHSRNDISRAELVEFHNQYLRAGIARIIEQPDNELSMSLHQWFEKHVRGKNLPYTPETIAYMLKNSLLSSPKQKLDKFVMRYLEMLPEDEVWSVLEVGVLNQQDIGIITRIHSPTSDLSEAAAEDESQEAPSETSMAAEEDTSKDEPVPEVLAVAQKGLGLKTLRGVLSFFDAFDGKDLSGLAEEERREIQEQLERDCVDAAINRWRAEHDSLAKIGQNTAISQRALNSQLYEWQCTLEQKLQHEFDLFDVSERRDKKTTEDIERCIYAPFLRQSTPARLAAVTIMGVLNNFAQQGASENGVPLSTLLTHVAKIVEEDVRYQVREREYAANQAKYRQARKEQREAKAAAAASGLPKDATPKPATPAPKTAPKPESGIQVIDAPKYDTTSWPTLIRSKVGAQLLAALIESAKIKVVREHPETKSLVSQLQPALARATVHRKGRKIGIIMPNKVLVDLMKREPRGDYLARHLPMLVEPEPWTRFDRGGFLQFPSSLLRVKNGERDQKIYAEAAFERGDLEQVSKGLDVLGKTAWRINRPVFDVIVEAWNSGVAIANIPPLDPNLPVPEEPNAPEDPSARREWLRRVKLIENEKSGMHSERCFMNFQLDIARAFRDQTFYFPHNMDFRGRAYPIPAYLNHMGADHVRGLLHFANGRELGKNGLRWLKVQLANVFGYDKASLEEREGFADEHVKDIFDSAENPLTGARWWLKAEDPWQCLAACYELKAALSLPDPTKFISHLPVHQDGTCNGLQHYAALGGDHWGAQQVNLMPSDRPADVYSAVANLVKEQVKEDLEAGNEFAKAVTGKITRKVVKQTVMTNVYGVTFIGAKAQVLKQLEAAYPELESETGVDSIVLASYIATKIFKALSTMFRGAHDIQYWLGECAGRVCRALTPEQLERISDKLSQDLEKSTKKGRSNSKKSQTAFLDELMSQFRSTIVWTTPLRMPIVQPYRKSGVRVIQTCLQSLNLQVPERSDPVNRRKQLQGFPPNFIHSLDASHMLLSALECDSLGLSFAAVHDSFWTHAADVDVMNRVLRDAFVRIHSEDVIGRLASEFKARYKGSLYLSKIAKNSEVAKEIMAYRSKNRSTLSEELLAEKERQRLLASTDPKEVKKGEKMVTPASIYESHSSPTTLPSNDGIAEVALGSISSSKSNDADDDLSLDGNESADTPDSSLEDYERMAQLTDISHFEATVTKAGPAPKKHASVENIQFWLPLTFPPVPVKGDFDVSQLKSSQYFFS